MDLIKPYHAAGTFRLSLIFKKELVFIIFKEVSGVSLSNIKQWLDLISKTVSMKYEVCPKSNETGVIKTLSKNIEIYQSQIPSK